jgi:hypothetical protein
MINFGPFTLKPATFLNKNVDFNNRCLAKLFVGVLTALLYTKPMIL